ncbi:hypothetical protein SNE510_24190 [Streptomyces sp. NE5-10]|nr:hypothetical protein SNE510_24190 [Streptomyces sp. NE5-10]
MVRPSAVAAVARRRRRDMRMRSLVSLVLDGAETYRSTRRGRDAIASGGGGARGLRGRGAAQVPSGSASRMPGKP